MSNNFLNLHIEEGYPLGEEADFFDIAEYYTNQYIKQQSQLRTLAEAVLKTHREMFDDPRQPACRCPACQLAREIMEVGNGHK